MDHHVIRPLIPLEMSAKTAMCEHLTEHIAKTHITNALSKCKQDTDSKKSVHTCTLFGPFVSSSLGLCDVLTFTLALDCL